MPGFVSRNQRLLVRTLTLVVIAIAAVMGVSALSGGPEKHLTAYFPRTIGIYKGSSVRVLGVSVGTVTRIHPEGLRVRVDMVYNADIQLPADVGVALVPPSIVSDRYLQFVPVYTGGPVLANNAVIQEDHTEVPVELDQIFGSLNDLNVALGPNGANAHGALSRLIDVGAANLRGNGAAFNATLRGFSQAVSAISDSRDALFGTVTQLQRFTTTLAKDDGGVRAINGELADVAGQLAGERSDLGQALGNLATALGEVQAFVADNKDTLTHDLHSLTTVTSGLVNEQQAIKEVLDEAPLGLHNLALAFSRTDSSCRTDGTHCQRGLLRTRANISPAALACTLLTGILPSAPGVNCLSLAGNPPPALTPATGSPGGSAGAPLPSAGSGQKVPIPVPSGGAVLGGGLGRLSGSLGQILSEAAL